MRIEKSVTSEIVRHLETCRVMPNSELKAQNFERFTGLYLSLNEADAFNDRFSVLYIYVRSDVQI